MLNWKRGIWTGLCALAISGAAAGGHAQPPSDAVRPNDNLVADGIPPLSRELADRAALYTEFRAAGFVDWDPSQRQMLIATRLGDVPQLYQVAMPVGMRRQVTFYREPVTSALYRPTADSRAAGMVFSRDTGGSEFFQLYWRPVGNPTAALISDGKSRNSLGPFSNSGKWMAFESTRRNGRDSDIYTIDPADAGSLRRVLEVSGGGWGAVDWSPDDRSLLVGEYVSANESRAYLVDVATGSKTLITPASGEPASYRGGAFSKDGKGVYFATDRDAEFLRLAYLELGSRRLEILTPSIPWDVSDFALSDDGRRIAFTVNEGGSETLHLMDARTRKEIPAPRLPLGLIGGLKFHRNSRDLAFTMSSARSASDVYSLDINTGKIDRWTESETGGLDISNFSEPERVRWKSFDDREISGFLYRPPAKFSGARPVIIDIHGGPEGQFQPRCLGRYNFYLNELGVALLFPNVRGSSGFGKTFLKLDNGEKREDSVRDIGALLDWIAKQPGLDAKRIMITGGSYGGYMTLACATHFSDRIRSAVDVVGISNFVTFLERTEAYRRDLRRVEYGDERDPKMRELLLRISPLTNASRIRVPLFIVAGKNDPRVSYLEAEQMVAELKKNGRTVWYLLGKDEGHGFAKKPNADFQFLATVRFVEETLLK